MNKEELQMASFGIILSSGNARTTVHEAFASMRNGDFDEAELLLERANQEMLEAHHAQTDLLTEYANGVEINSEIILIHAQDHLMTTMTLREVAIEMLALYKQLKS